MIVTEARAVARWAATHGLLRLVLAVRSRQGNADSALLLDQTMIENPFPHYAEMRSSAPLVDGAYCRLAVRHGACSTIVRHEDFGVAIKDELAPPAAQRVLRWTGARGHIGPIEPPSLLAIDGVDHQRVRSLVSRTFTSRAVERLRDYTEQVADDLLTRMAADPGDQVDLVQKFAARLPLTVICSVLGIPSEMHDQVLDWGEGATVALESGLGLRQYLRGERRLATLNDWLLDHLRRIRLSPGEDLLSQLCISVDEDSERLSETELLATALLILVAGFETTVHLLAAGARLLMEAPGQRELLEAEPHLWPNAVDEVLRLESPVQRTVRRAVRTSDVLGVRVEEGEYVVAALGAANRDPDEFSRPDVFDVARPNARLHLAFSGGHHFCLGAALARMEGEVALRALFRHFPRIQPGGRPEFRTARPLRAIQRFPVVLHPHR